ncbi:hypothetical protein [Thermoleptolyngbya sp.]
MVATPAFSLICSVRWANCTLGGGGRGALGGGRRRVSSKVTIWVWLKLLMFALLMPLSVAISIFSDGPDPSGLKNRLQKHQNYLALLKSNDFSAKESAFEIAISLLSQQRPGR